MGICRLFGDINAIKFCLESVSTVYCKIIKELRRNVKGSVGTLQGTSWLVESVCVRSGCDYVRRGNVIFGCECFWIRPWSVGEIVSSLRFFSLLLFTVSLNCLCTNKTVNYRGLVCYFLLFLAFRERLVLDKNSVRYVTESLDTIKHRN